MRDVAMVNSDLARNLFGLPDQVVGLLRGMTSDELGKIVRAVNVPLFGLNGTINAWTALAKAVSEESDHSLGEIELMMINKRMEDSLGSRSLQDGGANEETPSQEG